MCFVRIQSVRVIFACTKGLFILPAEKMVNFRNARLDARCAVFFWKIKQILFSHRLAKGYVFSNGVQNYFKMLLEMSSVLGSIVSTERNASLLTVIKQLRCQFMVVEGVEPGCLFKKFLVENKST